MIPIIVVSKNNKSSENYVDLLIKVQKFSRDRIFEIYPLKNEILISQVREIRREMMMGTAKTRLFILHDFDKATNEAQNALLKSLEEGGINNQFVLVAQNEYLLLPTVRSRSKIVRIGSNEEIVDDKKSDLFLNLIDDINQSADYRFLSDPRLANITREKAREFLALAIKYYRSKLSSEPRSVKIIKKALRLKALLESNNLNPQLAVDNLLIFIFKTISMKI